MGDGLRTLRILTKDDSLLASAEAALSSMEGWELTHVSDADTFSIVPPVPGTCC